MSGYIGPSPVPQSIQRRQSFTATAGQTTFGTTGYTDGDFIDVYLNGVKLVGGTDYTATNGTDIVLTTAASASDVLDFVTFNSFQLVDPEFDSTTFTGQTSFPDGTAAAPSITNTGDTNTGIFFPAADSIGFAEGGSEIARIASNGFFIGKGGADTSIAGQEFRNDDQVAFTRDGDHPLILNRKTSDGNIALFQKDETSVGAIGASFGDMYITSSASNHSGLRFGASNIMPYYNSTLTDDAVTLGSSTYGFKDLYLSGGAYLGGTATANKLDDYEKGSWTPTIGSGTATFNYSYYVKIGSFVQLHFEFNSLSDVSSSSIVEISGLPFAGTDNRTTTTGIMYQYGPTDVITSMYFSGTTTLRFYQHTTGAFNAMRHSALNSSFSSYVRIAYHTE